MIAMFGCVFLILAGLVAGKEDCSPGWKSAVDGCVQCEAGSYSAGGDQPDCTPCPSGTTSDDGAGECRPICEPGYHSHSHSDSPGHEWQEGCIVCPAGTYGTDGKTCISCTDGKTSAAGSASEDACSLQCTGLPEKWTNIRTDVGFPVDTGTVLRVGCSRGLVGDGGTDEVTCVGGAVFSYTLDLIVCERDSEREDEIEWTELEAAAKHRLDFDPATQNIEIRFNLTKPAKKLKFGVFARLYTTGSPKEMANVKMFWHMANKGSTVKDHHMALHVRDEDMVMQACHDDDVLDNSIPEKLTYDIVTESVVTVNEGTDAAATGLFNKLECEEHQALWNNLVDSNTIHQVMVYLGDLNGNIAERGLTISYRIVDKIFPTEAPTIEYISSRFTEGFTLTPFFTSEPATTDLGGGFAGGFALATDPPALVEKTHCSVYPMGVLHNFYSESAYYDVACHHVLAGDVFGVPDSPYGWFIYGEFDVYEGKRSLASMTFYPGPNTFQVQRGWMINLNGEKFLISEGEEVEMGGGCTLLFADLHVKVDCGYFVAYYDGMAAGHIEIPTREPVKGQGNVGLCYDNESGRRSNWQVGPTEGICTVTHGEAELCEPPPGVCEEAYCDDAARISCRQLYCADSAQTGDSATPGDAQLCAFERANEWRCAELGEAAVPGTACPADDCLWKFKVLGAGCPQDPFFTGCPIADYL